MEMKENNTNSSKKGRKKKYNLKENKGIERHSEANIRIKKMVEIDRI